jgi:hypothetical protein
MIYACLLLHMQIRFSWYLNPETVAVIAVTSSFFLTDVSRGNESTTVASYLTSLSPVYCSFHFFHAKCSSPLSDRCSRLVTEQTWETLPNVFQNYKYGTLLPTPFLQFGGGNLQTVAILKAARLFMIGYLMFLVTMLFGCMRHQVVTVWIWNDAEASGSETSCICRGCGNHRRIRITGLQAPGSEPRISFLSSFRSTLLAHLMRLGLITLLIAYLVKSKNYEVCHQIFTSLLLPLLFRIVSSLFLKHHQIIAVSLRTVSLVLLHEHTSPHLLWF